MRDLNDNHWRKDNLHIKNQSKPKRVLPLSIQEHVFIINDKFLFYVPLL